jgi:uncharacterized membrane protein
MIDDIALARAIHVLALVHWIGGVAVVTAIVLPSARRLARPENAITAFEQFERRFAAQVRISIALVGLTGVYMLYRLDAWEHLRDARFWWLDLMIAVWFVFALMVYVLEPLGIERAFRKFAWQDMHRAFALAIRLHAIALVVAALAIVGGIMGAHGGLP